MVDDSLTTSSRLLRPSLLVALSIAAIGAMSVEIFAVGARFVDPVDLSRFITTWVALNTAVIALGASFDQLGPRLISRFEDVDGPLLLWATLLPGSGAVLVFFFMRVLQIDVVEAVPCFAYILTTSFWTGERSLRLAYGEFRQLLNGALGVVGSCTVLLLVAVIVGELSSVSLLWVGALSNLAGYLVLVRAPTVALRRGFFKRLPRSEILLTFAISVASGAGLALSSGAIVLASSWGLSPKEVVAFAGMVNVARIPFMLLTSVYAPMNVKVAQLVSKGDRAHAVRLTVKSAGGIFIASCAVCAAMILFGGVALQVFISSEYRFSLALAVTAVGIEAFVLIAGAPRVLGVVLGRALVVSGHWVAGLVVFCVIAVSTALGTDRVMLAPLAGSLTVVMLSMAWAFSVLKRLR